MSDGQDKNQNKEEKRIKWPSERRETDMEMLGFELVGAGMQRGVYYM